MKKNISSILSLIDNLLMIIVSIYFVIIVMGLVSLPENNILVAISIGFVIVYAFVNLINKLLKI